MSEKNDSVAEDLKKYQQLRSVKPKGEDIVLDIGIGTGSSILDLSCYSKFVIGIDPDDEFLNMINKKIRDINKRNIVLLKGEAQKLNDLFLKEYFDFVNCYAAFHHFSEPDKVLKNIHQILKKGGHLYLYDPFFFSPDVRNKWTKIILEREKIHPEGDRNFYIKKEFEALLSNANLRIENIEEKRHEIKLHKWIKGGIKIDGSKSITGDEKALRNRVITLFRNNSSVKEEMQAQETKEGWTFSYPIVDILAVKG